MKPIKAYYCYEAPLCDMGSAAGIELIPIGSDPPSFAGRSDAASAEVLICRQGVANRLLHHLPGVKWLQLLNAGYEKVDLTLLKNRGIRFTNARSVYCSTIAEDVLFKMLALSRNAARHQSDQLRAFWPDDINLPNRNLDLSGKTLLILGAGAIGREVARRARAFDMRVEGYDPYILQQAGFDEIGGDLHAMLKRADYVVTSLPVTNETIGLMGKGQFSSMKTTAFFINVARGEIVQEDALIDALERGIIRGAAIDVAREELLPADNPLWRAPNIMITPHRAAYGDRMQERMCALILRNLHHYQAGEPLEDEVRLAQ